MSHFSKQLT